VFEGVRIRTGETGTGASAATTSRDLADLMEKGALTRTGERRHARYALNLE